MGSLIGQAVLKYLESNPGVVEQLIDAVAKWAISEIQAKLASK